MNSKHREALNQLLGLIDNEILVFSDGLDPSEVSNAQFQIDKADEALALPRRNCDVGNAKEQSIRFHSYCLEHNNSNVNCINCPIHKEKGRCELVWAQMPYEEVKE